MKVELVDAKDVDGRFGTEWWRVLCGGSILMAPDDVGVTVMLMEQEVPIIVVR